ncbi:MAG: succinate dehydrogenase assembly factor 2 [Parvularcula sp.]|jgi:antitoxin CptB|nr:succinate dehydrogenase assembly factor 2 [Parvularcula sp.]
MSEKLTPQRKQLLYRAMHRGFKEADIVVGRFAEQNLASMTAEEEEEFRQLLEVPDQELYAWIIGREEAPDNHRGPVLEKMKAFDVVGTIHPDRAQNRST